MRYTRMLIILMGLALAACATPLSAPTETPAPVIVTSTSPSPASPTTPPTAPPATLAPTVAVATEAPTAEPSTVTPTAEPPTLEPTSEPAPNLLTGEFVNGEVTVEGSYILDADHLTLTLSDDFRVDSGPDLYIILSGVGDLSLDWRSFSAQALNAPLLRLSPLANFSGAQTYAIPPGTGLEVYQSVVIWCDSFSVEFAAAPLRP